MIPDLTAQEIKRFYSKVYLGGCGLVWRGTDVNNHGYGRFAITRNGKRVRILAHRLAFKLAIGIDPGRACIRHGCDTPACCTPDCLLPGTQADNIRDAVERGRINTAGLSAHRARRDERAAGRLISGVKRCSQCRVTKPLGQFPRSRSSVDGHGYWCKACVSSRPKQVAP